MAAPLLSPEGMHSYPPQIETITDHDRQMAVDQFASDVEQFGENEQFQTNIEKIKTYTHVDQYGNERVRLRAAIFIGQSKYAFRMTEHAGDYSGNAGLFVMLHGILEDPTRGGAKELHNELCNQYPERDIVSICSDGYNPDGSPLLLANMARTIDDMALTRLNIVSSISGGRPVIQGGLSKGTVLAHNVKKHNDVMGIADIEGLSYHSPAIMELRRVVPDMIGRFGLHAMTDMAVDMGRMLIKDPKGFIEAVHVPSRSEVTAVACDVKNLVRGTDIEEVDAMLGSGSRIAVVGGDIDPLAQVGMWQKLEKKYPNNLVVKVKPGQAHGASLQPAEAAKDMRDTFHRVMRNAILQSVN